MSKYHHIKNYKSMNIYIYIINPSSSYCFYLSVLDTNIKAGKDDITCNGRKSKENKSITC